MSIGGKIRFLLLLLGISCIATALSLNNSITSKDLLLHEAKELQKNLAVKEQLVQNLSASAKKIADLTSFYKKEKLALNFINDYRDKAINVLVYRNNTLQFWSTAKISLSNLDRYKEGTSFVQLSNGYYELIKKTVNEHTIVFLINIKSQFNIQNQYLKSQISPELLDRNSLDLAEFTDKNSTEIFSLQKEYLFSVKLSNEYSKNVYATIQIWLWIVGLFSICLFINSFSSLLVKKGFLLTATFVISLFFLAFRISDLKYFWFNHQFNLAIFSPTIYAQSDFIPSLGDLLLNVIALTWVILFIYKHRFKYKLPKWAIKSNIASIVFHVLSILLLSYFGFLFNSTFSGLIYNSKINFDITNIINLGWVSWVSIFILCLVWFNLYILANSLIELSKQFLVSNRSKLIIFLLMLVGYTSFKLLDIDEYDIFYLVYALLIFIIAWNNYLQNNRTSIRVFAALFFCMAFLTSIKYLRFNDLKEHENRRAIAEKLMISDDPKVVNAIESFENSIVNDSIIISFFKSAKLKEPFKLDNYIGKKYVDGYLSRFEFRTYEFNLINNSLRGDSAILLAKYKDLVKYGSVKTQNSNSFYRINDTFGTQNYFGIVPIIDKGITLGILVVELISQPYDYNSRFPELLIDGNVKTDEDFSAYSFAFYKDNQLYAQSGKYTYSMINHNFKGVLDKVEFVNDVNDKELEGSLINRPRYSHAVYKADQSKLIVISKEKVSYVVRLATLSFFFLVFLLFSFVMYLFVWLISNADNNKADWFNINRYLMINANKILYKTRIQLSIVMSVVATLLIVGWTTFYYIKNEYLEQQNESMREKIRKVQLAYQRQVLNTGKIATGEDAEFQFNQFAEVNSSFLNLYDTKGDLVLTSLRRMYDYGVLGKKMPPKAFIYLNLMQKSEFLNPTEKIGSFQYAAAYAPIRDAQNKIIAYIGLPYYANEADYQAKIGLFINTLINIYALVFVLIGVLAVFLANQITNPLTFIQESIRRTKLGQQNQPIIWHRQDEIGSLIKEYNKMLAALELSAIKLARSERESAWREMAKQVAHEIKNPLTPLKLGVQLLEKSWKENDPNFERKFESFNRSFIEQIDSLATIASEFSNFAKMPDTRLENLELLPIIEQAIAIFNTSDRIEIALLNKANRNILIMGDKDQILRTFNNLLKNAIEASENKDKCVIKISLSNDKVDVYIDVEDNGKGIEEELHENIFVPNFTTKSSGTGLGLAFVKQAVENAGGTVKFSSTINKGTVFNLTFPIVD